MQLGTTTVLAATPGTSLAKLAASSAEVASSRSVCWHTRVSSRRVCRALSEKIARRSHAALRLGELGAEAGLEVVGDGHEPGLRLQRAAAAG